MKFSRFIKIKLRGFVRPIIRSVRWFSLQTYYQEGDGGSLFLGDNVGAANTLFNTEGGDIHVGDNTIFGYNVLVLTGRHIFEGGVRLSVLKGGSAGVEVPREGCDIKIGKNCWICSGAVIVSGVAIGDSVIVGAGSVVTKNLPSNVVAAGNPAKVIRKNV